MKALRSLAILAALAASAVAQTPTPAPGGSTARELPIFRAQLPGGTYSVALRTIVAVSQHEYVVDAVARVTEVNIDTAGSLVARFYYLEPAVPNTPAAVVNATVEQAQRVLAEGVDKTGAEVWKKVVKNYPATTHARTVEFRLNSLEQIGKIFRAADEALRLQKDTRITIE